MIHKGSLSKIGFPRIIQWLISDEKRGTIKVNWKKQSKIFLFENSKLLSAFSESAQDKLWFYLFKEGILSEEQLKNIREKQVKNGSDFEEILHESGYLSEETIEKAKQESIKSIVLTLFDWVEGDFWFYQDRFPPVDFLEQQPSLQEILRDGLQRIRQWRTYQKIFKPKHIIMLKPGVSLEKALNRPLTPLDAKTAKLLRNEHSVEEICRVTPFTQFETLEVLYDFYEHSSLLINPGQAAEKDQEIEKAESYHQKGQYWQAFNIIKQQFDKEPKDQNLQKLLTRYSRDLGEDLKEKIGSLEKIPVQIKVLDQEIWKNLNFEAVDGFIISRIDGKTSLKQILKLIKIDNKKVLITIYRLLTQGIIELIEPTVSKEEQEALLRELRKKERRLKKQNHYEALGVESGAGEFEIKRAYYEMVKKYHPDSVWDDPSGEIKQKANNIFMRIQRAYSVLSDPHKRERYDIGQGIKKGVGESPEERRTYEKARLQFRNGLRHLKSREYHKAIEYFQSAIDLNPNDPVFYGKLGEVCSKNPRWYKTGKNAVRKALELDPENPNYYCLLGLLFKYEGDLVSAEIQFKNAIQIEPENMIARRELHALGKKLKDLPKREVAEPDGMEMVVRKKKSGKSPEEE